MVEIDRIYSLAKEKGLSNSFLCKKMNRSTSYLNDARNGKHGISDSDMQILADALGTTVDYLRGKTDKKETPGIVAELFERDIRILNIIRKLPDDVLDALELDLYRKGLL